MSEKSQKNGAFKIGIPLLRIANLGRNSEHKSVSEYGDFPVLYRLVFDERLYYSTARPSEGIALAFNPHCNATRHPGMPYAWRQPATARPQAALSILPGGAASESECLTNGFTQEQIDVHKNIACEQAQMLHAYIRDSERDIVTQLDVLAMRDPPPDLSWAMPDSGVTCLHHACGTGQWRIAAEMIHRQVLPLMPRIVTATRLCSLRSD